MYVVDVPPISNVGMTSYSGGSAEVQMPTCPSIKCGCAHDLFSLSSSGQRCEQADPDDASKQDHVQILGGREMATVSMVGNRNLVSEPPSQDEKVNSVAQTQQLAATPPPTDKTTETTEYKVGTFNVYGYKDKGQKGAVQDAVANTDIFGFQEAGDRDYRDSQIGGAFLAADLIHFKDKDGNNVDRNAYYGEGSGNPIFWNPDKFDLVHSETRGGDGAFSNREPGKHPETRTTNIVILRDKNTGANLMVSNLHAELDAQKADDQVKDLELAAKDLDGKFNIAARIDLGDYNRNLPASLYGEQNPDTQLSAGQNGIAQNNGGIDHISTKGMSTGPDGKLMPTKMTSSQDRGHPNNGDFFTHHIVTANIQVNSSKTENAENKALKIYGENGKGAVLISDDIADGSSGGGGVLLPGDAFLAGFGTNPNWNYRTHAEFNDKTGEAVVTKDTTLKVYDGSKFDGRSREIKGNDIPYEDGKNRQGFGDLYRSVSAFQYYYTL